MGEIGGNDYNYAAFAGGNINQLLATVPLVVGAITNATSVSTNMEYYLASTTWF